jgi:hypothetical protein
MKAEYYTKTGNRTPYFLHQAANASLKDRLMERKHANQINLQRRQLQAKLPVKQLL